MIEKLEQYFRRPLTSEEKRYVEWILCWDKETIEVVEGLFESCYRAGKEADR